MLSFGKWLCRFWSSISTDEWSHMIYSGLSMSRRQVFAKKFPSRRQVSAKKFCNCLFLLRIEVLNPKCRAYIRNSFHSCGASSRFSSATFSERAKFGNNHSNYSHWANKLTRQPIRTTTRFSGSDVTGQHYRPVPSDVSLPRLSERRRRLKFRPRQDLAWNLTKIFGKFLVAEILRFLRESQQDFEISVRSRWVFGHRDFEILPRSLRESSRDFEISRRSWRESLQVFGPQDFEISPSFGPPRFWDLTSWQSCWPKTRSVKILQW